MESRISLKTKKQKLLYWLGVGIISLVASWILYQVQKGIIPSYEELVAVITVELASEGVKSFPTSLWGVILGICVKIWGVSYKAERISWGIMYGMVAFFAADLSMRDNQNRVKIGALPIFFVLMMVLHLTGNYVTEYFGDEYNAGIYTQYPLTIHIASCLAGILCAWILYQIRNLKVFKRAMLNKLLLYGAILLISFFMCTKGAIVFWGLLIVLPLIWVECRDFIIEKKSRCVIIFGGLFFLVLVYSFAVHFYDDMPGIIQNILISMQHRKISIKGLGDFRQQLTYYLYCLTANYNADMFAPNIDMLTKWVYAARIIMLVYIYILMYRSIVKYFKKDETINEAEQVLAWGALNVSLGFIFTSIGNWGETKYLAFLLPYGTILLCMHVDEFISAFKLKNYWNLLLLSLGIGLISYDPDWNIAITSKYMEQVNSLIDYADVGRGYASSFLSNTVTVHSEGEHWVAPISYNASENEFTKGYEDTREGEDYNYIIFDNHVYGTDAFDTAIVTDYFGTPDEVISDGYLTLLKYNDGVDFDKKNVSTNEEIRSIQRYYYTSLQYSDSARELDDYSAKIYNGGIQCGPFIGLEKGRYLLTIECSNLDLNCFSILGRITEEKETIEYDLVEQNDNYITLSFEAQEAWGMVEFVIENTTDTPVELKSYYLEKVDGN